jgi:hypothetical protein
MIEYMSGSLQPSKAITVLGAILSSAPNTLSHVKKACATLLSQQLLRPQGVRGLFAAVFGEEGSTIDDAPIEKLEHVARVLSKVPARMKPHVGHTSTTAVSCIEPSLGIFLCYYPSHSGSPIVWGVFRIHTCGRFRYLSIFISYCHDPPS